MNENSDAQLLRQFAEHGRDDAFREIVTRHADFVYSAALRQVESPDLAADLSQNVFVDLARKAQIISEQLSTNTSLAGWLHRSTRYAALNHLRDARRHRTNERQAMEQLLTDSGPAVNWEQIRPALDEALDALSDDDREALLLRFFKNLDFRAVGIALGVSDDTAQKRVSRALERLREFFSKRNVTIGASGLAVLISANAVQSAPLGLAATISAVAVLTGTAVSTSAVIAATKTIAMTTFQKTLIAAAFVTITGAGIFEAHQATQLRAQNQIYEQKQSSFADQLGQLQQALNDATNQFVGLLAENAHLKSNETELLKLRAKATQMRNESEIESDPAFQKARLWMDKENKLRQQFEDHPEQWIPEMKYLSNEEWLDQARSADLETANGTRCAMSNVRVAATYKFARKISGALTKYLIAHNQQLPESTSQLSVYFQPSISDAGTILARYEMINREAQTDSAYEGVSIIEKSVVDRIESPVLIGVKTVTSAVQPTWPNVIPNELMPIVNAYEDANNHEGFLSIYDLEPYATTPEQKEALNKFIHSSTQSR